MQNYIKRYRGYLALIGAFLMHFSLGTLYTYANISTYLISYMHKHNQSIGYNYSSWIFTANALGSGLLMFAGGYLELLVGTKLTALIGAVMFSGGIFCSSFVCHSFPLTLILYGLIPGIGNGITYGIDVSIGVRWFPNKAGLVNGIILSGFGLGTLLFNPIVTKLINPNNEPLPFGEDYYSDSVLSHLQPSIRILGLIYFGIQMLALLLMTNPPNFTLNKETVNDGRASSDVISFDLIDDKLINSYLIEEKENVNPNDGIEPKDALHTSQFYVIWIAHGMNALCLTIIASFWKNLGLKNVTEDDVFLSYIGSISSIFNALGRVVFGLSTDYFKYKNTCIALFGMLTILTSFFAHIHNKWLFAIFVSAIYFMIGGNLSAMPTALSYTFGPKRLHIILGLVYTSQIITSNIGSVLATTLMESLGLSGIVMISSILSLFSMMMVVIFFIPTTYKDLLKRFKRRNNLLN